VALILDEDFVRRESLPQQSFDSCATRFGHGKARLKGFTTTF
jgi:hypothetical protein